MGSPVYLPYVAMLAGLKELAEEYGRIDESVPVGDVCRLMGGIEALCNALKKSHIDSCHVIDARNKTALIIRGIAGNSEALRVLELLMDNLNKRNSTDIYPAFLRAQI